MKKKVNQIVITETSVTGDKINTNKMVNLTSVPNGIAYEIVQNIPNIKPSLKFLTLSNGIVYDAIKGEVVTETKKRTLANIIVDADDKNYNLKIRNLTKFAKVIPDTIIIIKANTKKKKNKNQQQVGEKARFCHFGHTLSVANTMNCFLMTKNKLDNLAKAVIVKTTDGRCSSVSSMILSLKKRNIPYDLETYSVKYNIGWLNTKIIPNKIIFKDVGEIKDNFPQGDQSWVYKQGYGDTLMTNMGPKILDLTKNEPIKKGVTDNTRKSILNAINVIKNKIIEILIKVKNFIISLFEENDGKEQNDEQSIDGNNKVNGRDDEEEDSSVISSPSQGSKENFKANASLAFTSITDAIPLVSNSAALYVSTISKNAKKEIKDANDLIANMQMNKMVARTGLGGNKTILNQKRTDVYNAYLANMTSYNTQEAITISNNLAADKYKKRRNISTSIVVIIVIVLSIVTSSPINIVLTSFIVMADVFLDIFKGTLLYYIIGMVNASSILSLVMSLLAIFVELNVKNQDTITVRSLIYFLGQCLAFLV